MSYEAKVLCDSVTYVCGRPVRLTTFQATMPRIVLAEFNTHRRLSRNSASSRAIPVEKRIASIESDPFIPDAFMANQKGMQAGAELDAITSDVARTVWMQACASAVKHAKKLAELGVHKQWANRLIEPYAWQTVIASATEWENFFNLRCHPDAQPEIRRVAEMMREAMDKSTPNVCGPGEYHTPFITAEDIEESMHGSSTEVDELWLSKLSVARCARVSYLTHDTNKRDTEADIKLHDRLAASGHMSPFEHVAYVDQDALDVEGIPMFRRASNFDYPWRQYRKDIPNEAVFKGNKQ